jgi:vitamin-K-epoxide reductase (warfarin-sensitive)
MGAFSLFDVFLCLTGLSLSLYAVIVEKIHETNPDFVALCDIDTEYLQASCSKVFASSEGRMLSHFGIVPKGDPLDVANALLGCIFYVAMLLSTLVRSGNTIAGTVANAVSCSGLVTTMYLGSVLYASGDICVLCISTHVINVILFLRHGPFNLRGGEQDAKFKIKTKGKKGKSS